MFNLDEATEPDSNKHCSYPLGTVWRLGCGRSRLARSFALTEVTPHAITAARSSGRLRDMVERLLAPWHAESLDAMEALFDHRADTFRLVTSDSVFAYLCRTLRERGAAVHIVGEPRTPDALRNAGDPFFEWVKPAPVETEPGCTTRSRCPAGTASAHQHRVVRCRHKCHTAQHPGFACRNAAMLRCHLSTLMGRDKLRIADVARLSGLNRSTVTALYRETATRIELDAVERLCRLFHCSVGELFELVPPAQEGQS